jgi:hypothetical protein
MEVHPHLDPLPSEAVSQWQKSVGDHMFVISSAARNLRSLTFVRDDDATFRDYDTASQERGGKYARRLYV